MPGPRVQWMLEGGGPPGRASAARPRRLIRTRQTQCRHSHEPASGQIATSSLGRQQAVVEIRGLRKRYRRSDPYAVDGASLRILRLLAKEELSAQEIATRLALGLTTLMHHLDLLREAGLLSAAGGRRRVYRLRRVALTELEQSLERYLLAR